MNPLKFLHQCWYYVLAIPNPPAQKEDTKHASGVTRIYHPLSNIKFLSLLPASRLHHKKKLLHKGNPAFPIKHHRFKPTMDVVRPHRYTHPTTQVLNPSNKKPALPSLNYKNTEASLPERCLFKRTTIILILGWLSFPQLIFRQRPHSFSACGSEISRHSR